MKMVKTRNGKIDVTPTSIKVFCLMYIVYLTSESVFNYKVCHKREADFIKT